MYRWRGKSPSKNIDEFTFGKSKNLLTHFKNAVFATKRNYFHSRYFLFSFFFNSLSTFIHRYFECIKQSVKVIKVRPVKFKETQMFLNFYTFTTKLTHIKSRDTSECIHAISLYVANCCLVWFINKRAELNLT